MAGKQPKRKARPGVDEYGRTPLHHAVSGGDFAALIKLLDSGSEKNAQDDNGWTALHFAAQNRHSIIITELLKRGADSNLVDSHGNSPLWTAMMNARGDFAIVKMLLMSGANADHKNTHGRSPRDIANTIKGGLEAVFTNTQV
jgi:ankyrin repeat protein